MKKHPVHAKGNYFAITNKADGSVRFVVSDGKQNHEFVVRQHIHFIEGNNDLKYEEIQGIPHILLLQGIQKFMLSHHQIIAPIEEIELAIGVGAWE